MTDLQHGALFGLLLSLLMWAVGFALLFWALGWY